MKNAIIAALCSAFIIPGLGQILNQDLKKGLFLLGGVFALLIGGICEFYRIMKAVAAGEHVDPTSAAGFIKAIQGQDLSLLWILLTSFGLLWAYSVVDAYWRGLTLNRNKEVDNI